MDKNKKFNLHYRENTNSELIKFKKFSKSQVLIVISELLNKLKSFRMKVFEEEKKWFIVGGMIKDGF